MPQLTIMIKRDFRSEKEARETAEELLTQVWLKEPKATVRFSIKDKAGQRICCGIQPVSGDFGVTSCNFEADPLFRNLL